MNYSHDLPAHLKFSNKAPKRQMELSIAYEMLTKFRRELKKLILVDLYLTDNQKRTMYNERDRLDKWIYDAEKQLMMNFDMVAGEWEYVNGY